ncbi:hypothetical protein CXG81DRAFT_9846 [Caulochytrium protostelioides]|uniref:Vacuolar-sorting protein SNF8 n=1 Tax=Caulochytrium protostelioides TaxID=1555241 RepID=A0A4P9XCP7_9FUNG|nr:hypothetical protein CXG81DRAFT_9846 [Caulochytrium protostelioides]|eukprot:RKP03215.1 hypothetical protein CXG81DRAFT_9846 [Caulochytrium protostelioides]
MPPRRAGIAGLQQRAKDRQEFQKAGAALAQQQLTQLTENLALFRSELDAFARTHRKAILRDPALRASLSDMCASLGIDPLASQKGFFSEWLGVGDFYYELGVQLLELCLVTRDRNGGIIDLTDVVAWINKQRAIPTPVTVADVIQAVKTLAPLGGGLSVITLGSRQLLQSVPRELNTDDQALLTFMADGMVRGVTVEEVVRNFRWSENRAQVCLDHLIGDGILWLDLQSSRPSYWAAMYSLTG